MKKSYLLLFWQKGQIETFKRKLKPLLLRSWKKSKKFLMQASCGITMNYL